MSLQVPVGSIYGFLQGVLVPLSARGETVIPERFQPEHIVELLARYGVTFFGGGPPAIYAGLLAARNLESAERRPFGPQGMPGRWRTLPGRADGALAARHGARDL